MLQSTLYSTAMETSVCTWLTSVFHTQTQKKQHKTQHKTRLREQKGMRGSDRDRQTDTERKTGSLPVSHDRT